METEKSKEKQGGKEQRKTSGRGTKMVYRACIVDRRALVWPRALSCPSMDRVVRSTGARQAMDSDGSSWARTPPSRLLLPSPAECRALLKPQLPRMSCRQPAP